VESQDDYQPGDAQDIVESQDEYQPVAGQDAQTAQDSSGDVTVRPKPGKAALYGRITYNGTQTGSVYVAVFDEIPPTGPPKAMAAIQKPEFPVDYKIDSVPPGRVWVIAYIDVKGKLKLDPDDPVSGDYQGLDLAADTVTRQDFDLKDPK
jgi:hypothetical protein